jgi:hypothetical protein
LSGHRLGLPHGGADLGSMSIAASGGALGGWCSPGRVSQPARLTFELPFAALL